MSKKNKQCRAWVEDKNARCEKREWLGANYCWSHYPKKEPIITLIMGAFLGLLITLTFNDPLAHFLSKCPLFYYLDKKAPRIENVIPDIARLQNIDKTTKCFKVSFDENDSGLNPLQSYIKLNYKDKKGYKSLQGVLEKTDSELNYALEKELKYGEYLFELLITDKANNESRFAISFVVRPKEEFSITITSDDFENSPYKNMFNDFIENKKSLIEFNPIESILQITIGNKFENIACLKDLFFTVDISVGLFLAWEMLGHIEATGIEVANLPEALDNRIQKGRIYLSQKFIHIDKIAPGGHVRFIVLIGGTPSSMPKNYKLWEGLKVWGTYLSEGYGRSERRGIELRIPKSEFKSSRKTIDSVRNYILFN